MAAEIHSVLDLDIEAIFRRHDAKVLWSYTGVSFKRLPDGTTEEIRYVLSEPLRSWDLVCKWGVISLEEVQEISDARLAAALFLYLFEKDVPPAIASRCAIAYALTFTVRNVDGNDREQFKKAFGPKEPL